MLPHSDIFSYLGQRSSHPPLNHLSSHTQVLLVFLPRLFVFFSYFPFNNISYAAGFTCFYIFHKSILTTQKIIICNLRNQWNKSFFPACRNRPLLFRCRPPPAIRRASAPTGCLRRICCGGGTTPRMMGASCIGRWRNSWRTWGRGGPGEGSTFSAVWMGGISRHEN